MMVYIHLFHPVDGHTHAYYVHFPMGYVHLHLLTTFIYGWPDEAESGRKCISGHVVCLYMHVVLTSTYNLNCLLM